MRRSQQGPAFHSPGGRLSRLMVKNGVVFPQNQALTPAGQTVFWRDTTPTGGETSLDEINRNSRNKAFKQDAQRVDKRAHMGDEEKAAISEARRESDRVLHAALGPEKKESKKKARRETYADIEPDTKKDLLARRRERAPVGRVCVSTACFFVDIKFYTC